MKLKLLTLFIVILTAASTGSLAQPKAEPDKKAPAAKADPLKKLKANRDEMRSITFYSHPSSPRYRNSNGVHLYFGKEDNGTFTPLRLVLQYRADSWLFVKRAWSKADGVEINLPSTSNFSGWERDNSGGSIWEWSDTALIAPGEKAAIRSLANSKSVTVRFEGSQYYDDRKLSAAQLAAMREVISAYEAATGFPWK